MKREVFRAEVGILLNHDDPEFDYYSRVYDKKYGYYDTNFGFFFSLNEAKTFIERELSHEEYGIVTSDILNLTDEDIKEIEEQDFYCDWTAWYEDDIVYKEIKNK